MQIFLVDDDQEDHEIFKMSLEKVDSSIEIVTAESGIEALNYLKDNSAYRPDIIFLDVNMPKMNGKDCVRELRKNSDFAETPMILYSTYDGQREINEAINVGASEFMTKPASITEFAKALKDIIIKHSKPKGTNGS